MLKILKGRLKDFIQYGFRYGYGSYYDSASGGSGSGFYGSYGYGYGSYGYGYGSYGSDPKDPKTWKDAGAEVNE